MFLFSLIVAGSFILGKTVAQDIDPITLTALRFLMASVILGVVLAVTGQLKPHHYHQPWRFLVLGGLFAFYFVTMFEALRYTSALASAAIFTTMPFFATFMDRMFFGRSNNWLIWAALTVGAAGALWIVFDGSWSALVSLSLGYGELIFFIGTASHAAYAVFMPRFRRSEPLLAMTFGVSTASALILLGLYGARIIDTDLSQITLYIWTVITYLAVMATLGTVSLIAVGAAGLSSAKITAYTYLTPFWVALIEFSMGVDHLHMVVLLGGLPIALALILLFFVR